MGSGGKRDGSGRPKGSGKFGTLTKAIRVPLSDVESVLKYVEKNCYRLPFYQHSVSAGFPSPADDAIEEKIDLNTLLIKHPAATFFLKVSGSSMIHAGIHDGDILIVDRSLKPSHGKIVIASVNGELTVKRLHIDGKRTFLVPENENYPTIEILEDFELHFFGVVTNVIHQV